MNVGKFILLNIFINLEVYAVDKLFVILDFIICCLNIFDIVIGKLIIIVIIDIVGFIYEFFFILMDVFWVILEEVMDVDVLFYVVDLFYFVW